MTSLSRTAWLVLALLWPVALLNYLERQMLASMKFSVMADIQSIGSEANWGKMLGQFNMPILCQIVRPELRATGYGIMNLVSISCGGFADWGFGRLRDLQVPLQVTFGIFASVTGRETWISRRTTEHLRTQL